jgi:hypothetical protein
MTTYYDHKESQAEAAACRQMEYDQQQYERDNMLEERRKQDAKVILRNMNKAFRPPVSVDF